MTQKRILEAIIVGSGFGGAVTCCRLAARWPGEVMLLERGKRYPKGSFARSPHDFANNVWSEAEPGHPRKLNGLFDIRNYHRMDSVVSAGLGGGSLIYANVFMPAPAWVFETRWPAQVNAAALAPYYRISHSVLGARPVPPAAGDPRRTIQRSTLYADFARADGATSRPADICVFFGKDYAAQQGPALPIGEQERNRYGANQTSCTYCGECDVGCNVHAKNTLDLNYLFAAEKQHRALIETSCEATRITPLNEAGIEDTTADGRHGYRVDYRDDAGNTRHALARRVVVSAGTLGSNELLLRCRDELGTLPRLSRKLGAGFSGNGDFLSFVTGGERDADPNYGPVITQYIDYGLQQPVDGKPAFLLEDAAYPSFAAWYVEGIRPALSPGYIVTRIARTLRLAWRFAVQSLGSGKWGGSVVAYFHALLQGDVSYRSSVLLFMGRDAADGVLSLRGGKLALDWPQSTSRPLYDAIVACGERFKQFTKASSYIPQPTWAWPVRNNVTVHPLGGCALAEDAAHGVVSSVVGSRGQAFGYRGLYVADGSILPTGVGANPSATIAALAEWIAEDITGNTPTTPLEFPMPEQHSAPVGFRFTEEMKGFVSPGQHTCQQGYDEGKAQGLALMFHLTIAMDDLDAFIADPAHQAQAIGYLDGSYIGGQRPVLAGDFNLFANSGDADRTTMLYRLHFENAAGEPLTLSGRKDIRNDFGFDAWSDTTTLYVNLYAGHVPAQAEGAATLIASGILHIAVRDFLHQLTTFRADAPTLSGKLDAIQRFGRLFMGKLWETHGLPRGHGRKPRIRTIPLHSLEGVKDAEVSTHYASTGDGLGISLLRFQRAPCQDVVLLVPGLTASSDMFIMPEHRNLTQVLLDEGFTDVWTLDGRISKRQPYNHTRHRFTVDDVALYDNPAALEVVRRAVGPEARIHIISHCLGALSVAMSLFGKAIQGVRSVIVNGVALTPKVGTFAKAKLAVGPFLAESVLGVDYLNPAWSQQAGISPGKWLAKGVSFMHRECDVPECHMTSFMWGYGYPVLFRHENLHEVTHRRTGDLFGGSGVHYYRHIRKMVGANNTAVKFDPQDVRYRHLPDNYLQDAADITTPMLLVAGQENALFLDSNVLCHERLEQVAPGRHQLAVIPGYGHADVIIGKNAAQDVFPRFVTFLKQNAH